MIVTTYNDYLFKSRYALRRKPDHGEVEMQLLGADQEDSYYLEIKSETVSDDEGGRDGGKGWRGRRREGECNLHSAFRLLFLFLVGPRVASAVYSRLDSPFGWAQAILLLD